MNKKLLAICLIVFIVGCFIGFVFGGYVTVKAVAHLASGFVDEDLVRQAIYQYKNNIGLCYPSLNISDAYLYNFTGNQTSD